MIKMKGKCPECEKIVDETEFIQEKKMCVRCFEQSKRDVINKVKALCEILEIDHLGLIIEGVYRLMDKWNELVISKV